MVAESLMPGASVSKVAQRYGVNANLLFTWRRQETRCDPDGGDPQAWLADVLARIADTPQTKLANLLPWNWAAELILQQAA